MSSLNKVMLIGNLGRDPEIRHTNAGEPVATVSLATTEKWTDRKTGEKRENVSWHTVVLWSGLAEIAEKYLAKGSKVYVEGRLQTRKWQTQSGEDRYSTEVVLSGPTAKLIMLSGNPTTRDSDSGSERPRDPGSSSSRHSMQSSGGDQKRFDELDDDIPF